MKTLATFVRDDRPGERWRLVLTRAGVNVVWDRMELSAIRSRMLCSELMFPDEVAEVWYSITRG